MDWPTGVAPAPLPSQGRMLTGYTTTNVDWRSSEKTGSPGRYRPCFRGLKDRCISLMLRENENWRFRPVLPRLSPR